MDFQTGRRETPGNWRAAVLLSSVASAKWNAVEPWAWLRDLFSRLPELSSGNGTPDTARLPPGDGPLEDLLPDRWLSEHPDCRWQLDDLRRRGR